jgi:DNA-directed RNA polymerase subunit RPC12/RpoP
MYPVIYNRFKDKYTGREKQRCVQDRFICMQCGAVVHTQPMISGVQNRNHCPYCLSSRHMDHAQAGDRLSPCKGIMLPIGLTVKPSRNKYRLKAPGELMLIHRCNECGKLSINRLAADDLVNRLMELFYASVGVEINLQHQLSENGIHMLTQEDLWLVECQLIGYEGQ